MLEARDRDTDVHRYASRNRDQNPTGCKSYCLSKQAFGVECIHDHFAKRQPIISAHVSTFPSFSAQLHVFTDVTLGIYLLWNNAV